MILQKAPKIRSLWLTHSQLLKRRQVISDFSLRWRHKFLKSEPLAAEDARLADSTAKLSSSIASDDWSQEIAAKRTVRHLPPDLVNMLISRYETVKKPLKLGSTRMTENIVDAIQGRWNKEECVKIEASDKRLRANMKVLIEALEDHTGGLVIWQSGSKLLIYHDAEHNRLRASWRLVEKERRETQSRMAKIFVD